MYIMNRGRNLISDQKICLILLVNFPVIRYGRIIVKLKYLRHDEPLSN